MLTAICPSDHVQQKLHQVAANQIPADDIHLPSLLQYMIQQRRTRGIHGKLPVQEYIGIVAIHIEGDG